MQTMKLMMKYNLFYLLCHRHSQEYTADDTDSTQNEPGIPFEPDYSTELRRKPNVGDSLSVYWPLMNSFYDDSILMINEDKHVVHSKGVDLETLSLDN